MGKLITAFVGGRPNGNTEVFVKEALWAAKEMGCDVEIIRLHECNLRPCKSCSVKQCNSMDKCPLGDDDTGWLIDKFLDADGVLFAAPVWAVGPDGIMSVFRDRVMGPKMDIASFKMMGEPEFIKGRAHARPGALISVGGATVEHWTSLGLPTLFTIGFSAQVEIVDTLNMMGVADVGAATLYEDKLEAARNLGRNLAQAVLHPDEPNEWLGDKNKGVCPGCHTNLLMVEPGSNNVVCAVCGRHGEMVIDSGKMVEIKWVENDPDDRLTLQGKATHGADIGKVVMTEYMPRKEEALENLKKYKADIDIISRPKR